MSSLLVRGNTHRCAYYPGYYVKSEVTLLCTDSPLFRLPGPHQYSSEILSGLFSTSSSSVSNQSSPVLATADKAGWQRNDANDKASAMGNWWMGGWLGGSEEAQSAPSVVDKGIDVISVFAQAYGICTADGTWLNQLQPNQGATLGAQGGGAVTSDMKPSNYAYVFQSQTQQLLSSMNIPVTQQRKFCFRFRLPASLPPSFRGHAIRYSYYVWLCIIWKTPNTSPQQFVVKIPFRVWSPIFSLCPLYPPYATEDFDYDWSVAELPHEVQRTDDPAADQLVFFSSMPSLAANTEQRKRFQRQMHAPSNILATNMDSAITDSLTSIAHVQLSNLHVPIPRRCPDPFQFVFQTIQNHLAMKNGVKEFLIQNQGRTTSICQVPFLKYVNSATHYCIGDTVNGALQHVPNDHFVCVKVTVRLECEEKVPVELFKSGTIVATKDIGVENPLTVPTRIINRSIVGEFEEYLIDCEVSNFSFMIPPSHPASLYTDKVTCEWLLRFEFHYATLANVHRPSSGDPIQCEDPIRWHQPLHVFIPPMACKNEKPGKVVYAVVQ